MYLCLKLFLDDIEYLENDIILQNKLKVKIYLESIFPVEIYTFIISERREYYNNTGYACNSISVMCNLIRWIRMYQKSKQNSSSDFTVKYPGAMLELYVGN